MKTMRFRYKLLASAIVGILIGNVIPRLIFSEFFLTSWLAILPWGIIGMLICYLGTTRKQTIMLGMTYMLFLAESFIFLGQINLFENFLPVMLFLSVIGLISIICGLVMGLLIYQFKVILKLNG